MSFLTFFIYPDFGPAIEYMHVLCTLWRICMSLMYLTWFWTVRGNQNSGRKPTQTCGKHEPGLGVFTCTPQLYIQVASFHVPTSCYNVKTGGESNQSFIWYKRDKLESSWELEVNIQFDFIIFFLLFMPKSRDPPFMIVHSTLGLFISRCWNDKQLVPGTKVGTDF